MLSLLPFIAKVKCWNSPTTKTSDWRKPGSSISWDWMQQDYEMNVADLNNLLPIRSLFLAVGIGANGHHSPLLDFRKYQQAEKDFHPDNGWVLLL